MRISDWSSDVCSSDLIAAAKPSGRSQRRRATSMGYGDVRRHRKAQHVAFAISSDDRPDLAPNRFDERGTRRSEERRVGKEVVRSGSSRCGTSPYKKKST